MKLLLIVVIALLFVSIGSTRVKSSDETKREANTEYVHIQDNSSYAIAQRELIALRKSGNEQQYLIKLREVMKQFPGKYIPSSAVNNNVFLPLGADINKKDIPFYETDWNAGDVLITGRNLSSPTSGNPTANNRLIRMAADTNGVLYVAFLGQGSDTLIFYSSSNTGTSWTQIQRIAAGSGFKYQGFDIAVSDTNGGTGVKIGMVVSITPAGSGYNGTVYYADMQSNGSGFTPALVEAPVGGNGRISPTIINDGWDWSPGLTYWYLAYQSADVTTGVTTAAIVAYTPNWGSVWNYDTARSTFNDYELDINYNFNSDSIYVLLTNNLSTSNPNLRVRWTALSNWGTNVSWKQFNPATTSSPEFDGQLSVNRPSKTMVVSYTITGAGTNTVEYSYTLDGSTSWSSGNLVTNQPNNVERASIYSLPQQNGSFRITMVSKGPVYDTVLYFNTFSIGSGFSSRQVVNQNNASPSLKPVIAAGFYPSAFATVVFGGSSNTGLFADGSSVITEVTPLSNSVPETFILGQNYPNPFNPGTSIIFSIPENSAVTLKIYDITGKEVALLIDKSLAAGIYNVNINAGNLSSGIYFYTLNAGNFTQTKKMMLIK